MLLEALSLLAIVAQDQTSLRSAPRDSAPQQAQLWQGDTLEVRGERLDYLQVYDHRRERPGYVRASQLRPVSLEAAEAPALLAVLRFLRDTPGSEALGIAYAAAYLRAAPSEAIGAEVFDALGGMADRLAARISARKGGAADAALSAHLEVAGSYGVHWTSFEREGAIQTCYDGEAFRRVLALPASAEQRARAALGLTRPECVSPDLSPLDRYALHQWRAEVLDRASPETVSEILRNRLQIRRAAVWSAVAFSRSRRNQDSAEAANRALEALVSVHPGELAEGDQTPYTEAAVRAGSSRAAALPSPAPKPGLHLATAPGEPGETCLLLVDGKHDAGKPLFRHCTFGTVWTGSAKVNASGTALTVNVQPLESWTELWVFHKGAEGWSVKVLPPAAGEARLGYAELAGWVPGNKRILVAREARSEGRWTRSFEIVRLDNLQTVARADKPESLSPFHRWQSAQWKQETVSLR